jgi:competence protein ComEA
MMLSSIHRRFFSPTVFSAAPSPTGTRRLLPALALLLATGLGLPGAPALADTTPAPAPATAAAADAVDVNSANASQLAEGLRGVGLSKAEEIVRYREQFGPFESIEELTEVRGIGAATLERNRERIRLE